MLRKQRLITAGAVLGAALLAYGGTAYWAGLKAEETLAEQHRMVAALPFFKVKSHRYERGWFSSTEVTELTFNRRLTGPYEAMLPDSVRPLLGATIKYTHHVDHGPFPGLSRFDLRPARAFVSTEFDMSESTRKTLAKFFGDAEPITVTNRLGLTGGGELKVNIPAFDYEETLSGVKVKWQGFDLGVDYASGYKEYQTEALSPGFLLEAATKGKVAFDGVRYLSDVRPGNTGVRLGSSELTVNGVQLNWQDSVPYSLKLNELVYLLTRVRVGEFINPSGEFRPSDVQLKALRYQIVTSEQGDFVNTRGKLDFERFSYNQSVYGPLKLDISANHLHGPTLVKLDEEIGKIPFEGVEPAKLRQAYLDAIKTHGVPLLANEPRLVVNEFSLKMPTGEAHLKGQLALNGFTEADLKDPVAFLSRFSADAAVALPRQTLENLVVAQARNLFTVDASAEEQPDVAEIDNLAKSLLDAQLTEWDAQRFIKLENGQISTSLHFKDGKLSVNQKPVSLPWQESDELEPGGPETSAAR
ncbi:uncharacterized protein YdgA (DUF945 family) [Crenobacter luteus]|uniref:YdgA family protein n=1 Tax=Crenobacter luteus TaxID=1452487 RepID=UPI0010438FD2|nr:YdgA family protein [Crenobacter luteus]TCP08481.1 uncharacterized protein YdgA (DUF945 family) [Crenobacter luteus]